MAVRIGSLFVNLALNDASFVEGLKRATASADKSFKSIGKAADFARVSLAGVAAGAASAFSIQSVRNALDYAGSIGEVATAIGVNTRELQVYRFAATQANLSQEQIEKGLGRLTRAIGQQNAAFAKAGITILDANGGFRATGDVLLDVAEKIASIPDPAGKAALAVQLFGREGQQLIPLLEGGAAGLRDFAAEAERTGQVLSADAIQKADIAADKLAQLQNQLSVQYSGVVAQNADSIVYLADALGQLSGWLARGLEKDLRRFRTEISATADFFRGTASIQREQGILPAWAAYLNPDRAIARGANLRGAVRGLPDLSSLNLGRPAAPAITLPDLSLPPAPGSGPGGRAGGGGLARIGAGARAATTELDRLRQSIEDGDGWAERFQETVIRLNEEALKPLASGLGADSGGLLDAVNRATADLDKPFKAAAEFGKQISDNLAQAIVYGQDLGTALVNSLKAAAAEALASGLFKPLLGGGTAGNGGLLGGLLGGIGSIFGGARATGGPVSAGRAYLVGERGPEAFVAGRSGSIIPNNRLGGGGQFTIKVEPSPLFVTTVVQASAAAGQNAAQQVAASQARRRLPRGLGA